MTPRPPRPPLEFDDAYLRLRDLARYSGVPIRTLYDYLRDPFNPLPHYRVGKLTLVRRSDYDAWALSFKVTQEPKDIEAMIDAMVKR